MAGFYLRRSLVPKGTYARITSAMIPARGSALSGARYNYQDRDALPGQTYDYLLEVVNDTGKSDFVGHARLSIPGRERLAGDNTQTGKVSGAEVGRGPASAQNPPAADDPQGMGCAITPEPGQVGAGALALILLLLATIVGRGFVSGQRGRSRSRRSGVES